MGGFYGQTTALLRSLGYNCENYALYYPRHKAAFDKFNIPFKINKNNPSRLPYKNNSCIAVISSGVLEHVHEEGVSQQQMLKEIHRILKPRGLFFCWNLPRKYSLIEFIARLQHKSCHDILFTKKTFNNLLTHSGLKTIHIDVHGDILKIKGLRKILYSLNPWNAFRLDYYISKTPGINFFAHHITAIAQK